jgi:hypothetical protein
VLDVLLQGGLGNQLFQVAFGIARSGDGEDVRFLRKADRDGIRKQDSGIGLVLEHLGFDLEELQFSSPVERACNFLMREYANEKNENIKCRIIEIAVDEYLKMRQNYESLTLGRGLGFFEVPERVSTKNELVIGYFQSHRWADELSRRMSGIFTNMESRRMEGIELNKEKSVVVHVRRGDYDQEGFGWLGQAYYEKALNRIQEVKTIEQVILFSDNLPVAYKMIERATSLPIMSIEKPGESALTTLEKMEGAAAYVIANSSLSWWASYLSESSSALIVAPEKWFKGFKDPRDLIPPNWLKIGSSFM